VTIRKHLVWAIVLGAIFLTASSARAAVLTWDPSMSGGLSVGGSGNWDTSDSFWWNNSIDTAWTTNDALFLGSGGPVTVTAPVSATSVTFNGAGYSLGGGTLTMTGATPTISSNYNTTISSVLAGSAGLVVSGSGVTTLASVAAYTGTTSINSGTLMLQGYSIPVGTVALYQFNNPAKLGQDTGPNGYNLVTASGAPAYSSNGKFLGALSLNGASTLNYGGAFPTLVPTGSSSYTIALWEKNVGSANTGGFLGWGNSATNQGNNFRFASPNALNNYWYGNDWTVSGLTTNPMDGNWHYLAITYSNGTQTMYVDGAQVGQDSRTGLNAAATNFVVGKTIADVDFSGLMNDLTIANVALSQAQLATLMNNGGAGNLPAASPVSLSSGATLDLNGVIQTVGSLSDGIGGGGSLISSNTAYVATLTLNPASGSTTFSGQILGGGTLGAIGVMKSGAGTQVLAGSNTYTGGTTLAGGILQVANNAALGSGSLSISGGTLQNAAGTAVTLPNNLATTAAVTIAANNAPLTLSGNANFGAFTTILNTSGNTITLGGTLTNPGNTGIGLEPSGGGTLVLAGSMNLVATANNSGNTQPLFLNQNGVTATITGVGSLSGISVGWNSSKNTLNFASTGTINLTNGNNLTNADDPLAVGQTNSNGVVNQTSGTVNVLTGVVALGRWDGSYGAYNMFGGSLVALDLYNGGYGNDFGSSYFYQNGGVVTITGSTVIGVNSGAGPGASAGINVLRLASGSFNQTAGNFLLGHAAGGLGVATVSGGSLAVSNGNIIVGNNATGTGILNLSGGTVQANAVTFGSGTGIVNFNGGYLQASSNAQSAFLTGLTSANVYSSGGTVDNSGKSITIGQALLVASGSGLSTVPVTAGGSGYIGAPVVKVTGGGGSGATAEAVISGGSVSSIVFTNPGSGYTSAPSFTISGGGGSGTTLGTPILTANSGNGGLTFTGAGVTTLTSNASSLGGNLVVNGGTLQAASANGIANPATSVLGNTQSGSRSIIVNNGTLQFTAANVLGLATAQSDAVLTPIAINAGGTVTNISGGNNIIGSVILSGGTLTGGAGLNSSFYTWQLSTGSVTVNTAPSVMTGNGANTGFNMAQTTRFNVAATGGGAPDLTVSAPLGDVQSALAPASLVKTGNGSMLLTATNTYTGTTTVSGGTLALAGASNNLILNSPTISVGAGSTLNVTGLNGGSITLGTQTLTGSGKVAGGVISGGPSSTIAPGSATSIGTLTVGSLDLTAGGSVNYVLGTAGTSAATPGLGSAITVAGALNLPSSQIAALNLINNNNNGGQGSIGTGYYDLFNYYGALNGSASTAFGSGAGAKVYTFTNQGSNPSQLILQITIEALHWTGMTGGTGAADGGWNLTSTNWSNDANNAAIAYADGAVVNFGDINPVTGGSISNSNITLNSTFAPTSITFSNSAVNYSISGIGGITGATGITLNGTGIVTLATANSFTSPVAINSGALTIANAAALGNSSAVIVANGAALQIQGGINSNSVPLTLNGAGLAASPAGALDNLSGNNNYSGAVSLASSATIASSSGTLTLSGGIANNGNLLTTTGTGTIVVAAPATGGGGLTQAGPGNLVLSAVSNYAGATTVSGGTLTIGTPNALPTGALAGNVTVSGGGALNLSGNSLTINGLFGSGIIDNTAIPATTLLVGNNGASASFTGVIQNTRGSLGLEFLGNGTMVLGNTANTYAGGTTVNGGVLNIAGDGALGAAVGGVTFTGNSTLQFAASTTLGAARNISIAAGVTATLDTQGNAVTIAGPIFGNGNLLVPGNDQLVLSSPSSILGGALTQSGSSSLLVSGAMTVGALTQTGSSNLTITGGIATTGAVTIGSAANDIATVNISGGSLASASTITFGNAANSTALYMSSGALAASGALTFANAANSTAAVNMTGGLLVSAGIVTFGNAANANSTLNIFGGTLASADTANVGTVILSNVAGATTIANMTGGAINSGGQMMIGNNGTGVLNISGGTVTVNSWLALGRASATGFGVLNLNGSGVVVHALTNNVEVSGDNGNGNSIIQQSGNSTFSNSFGTVEIGPSGWGLYTVSNGTASFGTTTLGNLSAVGAGILTVSGSANVNAGTITLGGATNGSGIVTLNGGLLTTTQVTSLGSGTTVLNLNGGTLQAAAGAQSNFATSLSAINVYSGGALINTNSQNIAVSNLVAPAGNGVQSVTSVSGSGYVATPVVKISGGGGSGATAEAAIDGNGNLTGITITNPGTGYTSTPTVSVVGGNGALTTTPTAALNSGNTSGGLTVTGGGMLTLNGSNTYTGATTISSGTLQIGNYLNSLGITHRWSFNNSLADTVGGVSAISNGNATLSAGAITITGSGSVGVNYVSLGNGSTNLLPKGNSPFTIEFWGTENGIQSWSRTFDFGSSVTNYLTWSWTTGLNNPGSISPNNLANYPASSYTNIGTEYHDVLSVTPSGAGSIFNYYQMDTAGNILNSGSQLVSNWNVSLLTQTNMWLGRSEFGDQDADASYDEFRIFNTALSPSQITTLGLAGPDTNIGSPVQVLPAATRMTIAANSVLDLNGGTQQIASLNDAAPGSGGSVTNSNSSSTSLLTLSSSGGRSTFSGVIQDGAGGVSLMMTGSGTQVLAGTSTYSGSTLVLGGVLAAGAANALSPSSAFTVDTGGVLDVTAAAQTIGSLSIGGSGTLNLSVGNLLASIGSANFAVGSTLNISNSAAIVTPDVIMTYSGSANGTFTNVIGLPASDQLFYSSGGSLEIIPAAVLASWIQGSGNWSLGTNWSTGSQPNGAGQAALLNQSNSGAVSIALDVPVTLGSLQLASSTTSYALSGNTLTFNNNGGTSSVTVTSGTHSISSQVLIAGGNLDIAASNSSVLTISGSVADDGGARSLTLDGDGSGQLVLSGSNTYSGGTIVNAGTLVVDSTSALLDGSSLTVGQGATSLFTPASAGPSAALAATVAVPEPGTLVLLFVALGSGCVRWRFRRK
jgi:fibronectin-binding autotransporter adhesin